MADPNTIDYSKLNKSLQTKRPIDSVKTNVAEAIWKVFLSNVTSRSIKEERLGALSEQIEKWSENMKIRLILTIDHLSSKWLLTPESIKSLSVNKIMELAWAENSRKFLKDDDKKIQNIIDYLVKNWRKDGKELTTEQKEELNQAVIDWLDVHYWKLAEKSDVSDELKARNEELEEELKATDAANEVVEAAVLSKWSRSNIVRIWKSIEKINENKKWLDPVTKSRKVLRQANSFAVFGSWKRFDWINKLPKKIDINKEYVEAVNKLKEKMSNTKLAKEKVAIRYIMRQVNIAYKDYIDATNISEETRRQNMKDINMAMAA